MTTSPSTTTRSMQNVIRGHCCHHRPTHRYRWQQLENQRRLQCKYWSTMSQSSKMTKQTKTAVWRIDYYRRLFINKMHIGIIDDIITAANDGDAYVWELRPLDSFVSFIFVLCSAPGWINGNHKWLFEYRHSMTHCLAQKVKFNFIIVFFCYYFISPYFVVLYYFDVPITKYR